MEDGLRVCLFLSHMITLLGPKHRKVSIGVPLFLLLLHWESMAAHRTTCRKVMRCWHTDRGRSELSSKQIWNLFFFFFLPLIPWLNWTLWHNFPCWKLFFIFRKFQKKFLGHYSNFHENWTRSDHANKYKLNSSWFVKPFLENVWTYFTWCLRK